MEGREDEHLCKLQEFGTTEQHDISTADDQTT